MTRRDDDWNRLQSLFEEALELPEDARNHFLVSACAGETSLLEDVQSLLASYGPAERELEDSPIKSPAEPDSAVTRPLPADAIPGYELLKELHRGGQGVVYLALQQSTKREVALKVMIEGPFADAAAKLRFEREVELSSSLQHPGIVPIFDSGITHHQYYYAMEYIRGQMLNDFVRDRELSVKQTLELFVQVCDAVGYAHQKGIIHRDLKPSNIMVDGRGVPRVLDFGLAKRDAAEFETNVQPVLVSVTGQIMGTLAYMSPEQAEGRPDRVGVRSDVYSLGVVLYELLTNQLPYDLNSSMEENLATIRNAEPQPLSLAGRRINSDVKTIILKAVSKDNARRYATADTLGEDITRYLDGQPIVARRDSALYVLRRTLQKHFIATAVATSFLTLLAISSIVGWALFADAQRAKLAEAKSAEMYRGERDRAANTARQLTHSLYFSEMNFAGQSMQSPGGVGIVREILARWNPDQAHVDLRGWEWYRLLAFTRRERVVFEGHAESVWDVALSPDGTRAASASLDATTRIWNLATGRQEHTLETVNARSVDWSPDGKRFASSHFRGAVFIWDAASGRQALKLEGHALGVPVTCIRFSPDGSRLASTGRDGELIIWDADSGDELRHIHRRGQTLSICWNPTGDRLASASGSELSVLNPATGENVWTVRHHQSGIKAVAWSPDATRIATSGERRIRICDATSGRLLRTLEAEAAGIVWSVCWSPDSTQLASAHDDCAIRIWDVDSDRMQILQGHTASPLSVQWSSDGTQIISCGLDGTVRLWDVETADQSRTIDLPKGRVADIDWSSDGSRLASSGWDRIVRVWDAASGNLVLELDGNHQLNGKPGPMVQVRWSPDDSRLAAAGQDDTVRVWDATTGEPLLRLRGHEQRVIALDWHPDGIRLASGDADGSVRVWDAASGAQLVEFPGPSSVFSVAWSPDGSRLASVSSDESGPIVSVRTADGWAVENTLRGHTQRIDSVCWNSDGSMLATGSHDGTMRVWDAATGRESTDSMRHEAFVTGIDWSPDTAKPRLCSAGNARHVHVWDSESGKLAITLVTPFLKVSSVQWSPDGRRLAASGGSKIVIWDATIGYQSSSARPVKILKRPKAN